MPDTKPDTENTEPSTGFAPTAETSGITRLSKTDSETEGAHLRRVANELSGSGEERLAKLRAMLSSRNPAEQIMAARELGKIGSLKAIHMLRELLVSSHEVSWRLAIHGLRVGGSREGWLCLEGVALDDASILGSDNYRLSELSFRRLMAMGRTKMMDRLFRAADGHSRSIPGDVAKKFSIDAIATLSLEHKGVMEHRLGLLNGASATPADTAGALGIELSRVRVLELESWQAIHSPIDFE
ncbi:MAG: HEAT repeat domain-containing protein [Chloroflexi bacterium]|nr:HEAT repeat domain-containing protein [Chloroflexota bacterium]MDA1281208.1 HEAT repeat domain-containing protein [Chloroflexota bacterium]